MGKTRMELNASRFFIDGGQSGGLFDGEARGGKNGLPAGAIVSLCSDDARHIYKVLRMAAGDQIIICDGAGLDYVCELAYVGQDGARAIVLDSRPAVGEPRVKVTLYQSLPKNDKFEYVVQKCVEAGVYRIMPVFSAFTQFADRIKRDNGQKLLDRWRRIAYEAAKQSGRGTVPEICGFSRFTDAVDNCARITVARPDSNFALVPYENEDNTSVKSALLDIKKRVINNGCIMDCAIHVFIGPEGGYSGEEIYYCKQKGVVPVTLGPRILRSETAGLAVLCNIIYEFDM